MSIEKHSRPGWYYVKHYPNGRHGKPERIPIEGYARAVTLDNSLKSAKPAGSAGGTQPRLDEISDEYLAWARGEGQAKPKLAPTTYATRERRLNHHILPHFGKYRVRDLQQTVFDTYEKTVAKWTYHTDFNALMALIRWMIKRNYAQPLTWQPERPAGKHAVKPVPHPADLMKAIDSMPKEKHRVLFRLMLYTGLRWNEVRNLRWEDVDLRAGTIRIKEIQDAEQDYLSIPQPLQEWMTENKNDSGLIWPSYQGKPYATLQKVLADAGNAAGIKITSHTFRHASATYLYEQTNDIYAVQAHLRHRKVTTTQIYARMSIARRKSSVSSVIDYVVNRK